MIKFINILLSICSLCIVYSCNKTNSQLFNESCKCSLGIADDARLTTELDTFNEASNGDGSRALIYKIDRKILNEKFRVGAKNAGFKKFPLPNYILEPNLLGAAEKIVDGYFKIMEIDDDKSSYAICVIDFDACRVMYFSLIS